MQDLISAFSFISSNIHLAGWVFLIGLAWKVSRFFTKASDALSKLDRVDETLNTVATNHLPHLEEHMNNINDTLRGIRQDILTIMLSKVKE